jgi:hypothetical protein
MTSLSLPTKDSLMKYLASHFENLYLCGTILLLVFRTGPLLSQDESVAIRRTCFALSRSQARIKVTKVQIESIMFILLETI